MKFTMSGLIAEQTEAGLVSVSWDDGVVTGDELAVLWLEAMADNRATQLVGPPCGPYSSAPHLDSPISALELGRMMFTWETFDVTGEVPEIPSLIDEDGIPAIHGPIPVATSLARDRRARLSRMRREHRAIDRLIERENARQAPAG